MGYIKPSNTINNRNSQSTNNGVIFEEDGESSMYVDDAVNNRPSIRSQGTNRTQRTNKTFKTNRTNSIRHENGIETINSEALIAENNEIPEIPEESKEYNNEELNEIQEINETLSRLSTKKSQSMYKLTVKDILPPKEEKFLSSFHIENNLKNNITSLKSINNQLIGSTYKENIIKTNFLGFEKQSSGQISAESNGNFIDQRLSGESSKSNGIIGLSPIVSNERNKSVKELYSNDILSLIKQNTFANNSKKTLKGKSTKSLVNRQKLFKKTTIKLTINPINKNKSLKKTFNDIRSRKKFEEKVIKKSIVYSKFSENILIKHNKKTINLLEKHPHSDFEYYFNKKAKLQNDIDFIKIPFDKRKKTIKLNKKISSILNIISLVRNSNKKEFKEDIHKYDVMINNSIIPRMDTTLSERTHNTNKSNFGNSNKAKLSMSSYFKKGSNATIGLTKNEKSIYKIPSIFDRGNDRRDSEYFFNNINSKYSNSNLNTSGTFVSRNNSIHNLNYLTSIISNISPSKVKASKHRASIAGIIYQNIFFKPQKSLLAIERQSTQQKQERNISTEKKQSTIISNRESKEKNMYLFSSPAKKDKHRLSEQVNHLIVQHNKALLPSNSIRLDNKKSNFTQKSKKSSEKVVSNKESKVRFNSPPPKGTRKQSIMVNIFESNKLKEKHLINSLNKNIDNSFLLGNNKNVQMLLKDFLEISKKKKIIDMKEKSLKKLDKMENLLKMRAKDLA